MSLRRSEPWKTGTAFLLALFLTTGPVVRCLAQADAAWPKATAKKLSRVSLRAAWAGGNATPENGPDAALPAGLDVPQWLPAVWVRDCASQASVPAGVAGAARSRAPPVA